MTVLSLDVLITIIELDLSHCPSGLGTIQRKVIASSCDYHLLYDYSLIHTSIILTVLLTPYFPTAIILCLNMCIVRI